MPWESMPLKDRFFRHVDKTRGECWIWTAHKSRSGYGTFWMPESDGKPETNVRAHRLSWILTNGPIPDDLCVLHKCDNRACVNPGHLFLGTNQDNTDDMIAKGRKGYPNPKRGEESSVSVLTTEQVIEIKRLLTSTNLLCSEIASQMGIARHSVYNIKLNRGWDHVPWPEVTCVDPPKPRGNSKFTREQVLEIRSMSDSGASTKQIAERFSLSVQCVWSIATRRTYANIV